MSDGFTDAMLQERKEKEKEIKNRRSVYEKRIGQMVVAIIQLAKQWEEENGN